MLPIISKQLIPSIIRWYTLLRLVGERRTVVIMEEEPIRENAAETRGTMAKTNSGLVIVAIIIILLCIVLYCIVCMFLCCIYC